MTATQNSIESYIELMDTGELGEKQIAVLNFIKKYPNCSYNDISRVMHLHHNTVTARIKELRDMGYIVCSGTKIDTITNKRNNTYRIRNKDEVPDDTTNDARPKIPSVIAGFLIDAIKGKNTVDKMQSRINGIEWLAVKTNSDLWLCMGSFFEISNIMNVCEDNAHKNLIVEGFNYTLSFRLN